MKFKTLFMILFIIFGTNTILHAEEDEWVHFVEDNMFSHYYNKTTMERTDEDIIGVWVKVVPKDEKAIDILMEARRIRAFLMEGFEDYQYTTNAIEIDCRESKSTLIEQRDYGKGGKVLDKVRAVLRNWQQIMPGSYHALYQQVLCKEKKSSSPKK